MVLCRALLDKCTRLKKQVLLVVNLESKADMPVVGRLIQIWTICVFVLVCSLGRVEAAPVDDVASSGSGATQAGQSRPISDPIVVFSWTGSPGDAGERVSGALKPPSTWKEVAAGDVSPKDASIDSGPTEITSVRELQRLLLQLGFEPGPIDGKFGPSTASAISAYQEAAGLLIDGKPSRDLLQQLREDAANLTALPLLKPNENADPQKSESATSSVAADLRDNQGASLAGTTWLFTDESGSEFSLEFIQGGGIKGILYENFWNWHQSGEDVEILYDNKLGLAVSRVGTVKLPGIMEGTAIPSRGKKWTWKARRTKPPVMSSEETRANSSVAAEPLAAPTQPAGPAESMGEAPAPPADKQEAAIAAGRQDPIAPDYGEKSARPEVQSPTETGEHVPVITFEREESAVAEQQIPNTESRPAISARPPKVIIPAEDEGLLNDKKERNGGSTETAAREPKVYGRENEQSRIIIRALADSWVEVTDDDGSILFSRVLRKADSYRVPAGQRSTMVTGNAGGLEIIVDGQLLPALGPAGAVRRSVALDPVLLKSGAANQWQ